MEKNLRVWFTSPQQKIRPRSHLTWGKVEDFHLYVAKNSTEGCQVSVKAPEARPDFTIEVAGDTKKGNFEIKMLKEMYANCEGALYPDPVVPDDGKFDLEKECNVTYLINIVTSHDSVAGDYAFKVILREKGEIYGEYDLTVTVWNFAIKPVRQTETMMNIEKKLLLLRQPSDDPDGLYKKYYDKLLNDYHINAYNMPYDILDPRADEYLNNPMVTSFLIPYADDDTIRAYHKKLSSNPEWMKKGYFNVVDEPCNMKAYEDIKVVKDRLDKLFPGYQLVSAFFRDPEDAPGTRAIDLLEPLCNIWGPKSRLFKDQWFADYMRERDKKGDRVWWYVCWEPGLPYSNLFIDMEGFYHRILFWQQFQYDVHGLIYWESTHWRDSDPWDSAASVEDLSCYCFGDGSLFYPGNRVGIDGPVGSLRLELIRSGIEDYYMLQMAEQAFGRQYVDDMIKILTPNIREYNDDHLQFEVVREEIGNKLSEFYSK